jgi:hypothetical protein
VIANVARITATGVAHCGWGEEAGRLLHDWAGWLMMPLALALLWLEMLFLGRLLVEVDPPAPLPIDYGHPTTPEAKAVGAARSSLGGLRPWCPLTAIRTRSPFRRGTRHCRISFP